MTRTEEELRTRLYTVKDSRDRDRQRHDRHFAELTEVKAHLHTERELRGLLESVLANVVESLEEGTATVDVVRGIRTMLGLGFGGSL